MNLSTLSRQLKLALFLFAFCCTIGNFITDIIQNVTEVDCVILNSGTLRSDCILPPGKFKMKVQMLIFSRMKNLVLLCNMWR